ncbi:MAG: ATP-binding protein [Ignavibacteria bacterium]|nr:ATP-binding protein [Ignavibacteria bacterium]
MVYNRKILSECKKHLSSRQVTVLTGMRRTGKTTIIKQLLDSVKSQNKIYFDLEELNLRSVFGSANYKSIIDFISTLGIDFSRKAYIAIDEIQNVKNLPSVIKFIYDNYKVKFLLTGSSSYYIKNLFSESLAGRKKIFNVNTLDFGEFLTFKNPALDLKKISFSKFNENLYNTLNPYYEEYIKFGGFPEVVLAKTKQSKKDLLNDILDSYISIDIRQFKNFKDAGELKTLFKILASRAGSKIDISKLSAAAGISRPTLYSYMELLESTFFVKRLNVISKNPDVEISKAQKLYICDNGLLNVLAEVSSGVQFENCVFNQLQNLGGLNYYSLKTGKEINFILNKNTAYETKERFALQDVSKLKHLASKIKLKKFNVIFRYPSLAQPSQIWGGFIV